MRRLSTKFLHILSPRGLSFLAFVLCILSGQAVSATHLVGGSTSYRYVGKAGSNNRYEIKLIIYRDCLTGQADYDPTIQIGFYEARSANPSRDFVKSVTFSSANRRFVNPPSGGSNCTSQPRVCLEEGIYTTFIDLPPSSFGWHYTYIRCCRNSMENLRDKEGQTYYGFITPDLINGNTPTSNSSPTFNDVPTPYICPNDTINLLYTANDPDGDSLVYSIAHPWNGGDENDPAPDAASFFSFPQNANYNSGYSYLNPFGTGGVCNVDPLTGLLKIYVPSQGLYAIAVDVKEYRDGVLLGTTRRDIQLIVLSPSVCGNNPAPYKEGAGGQTNFQYTVFEGEVLDFLTTYRDNDNNINIEVSGEPFDASRVSRVATVSHAKKNNSTITSAFSWQPPCLSGRGAPYIISVKVTDDGCPSKTLNHTYSIFVRKADYADAITGPSPGCVGGTPSIYRVNKKSPFNKIVWAVSGGTIVPVSAKDEEIGISWNPGTSGSIRAIEVNNGGCSGDTVRLNVSLFPRPVAGPISGPTDVCVDKVNAYSVTQDADHTYNWSVTGGSITSGQGSSNITVLWTGQSTGSVKVTKRNNISNCESDSSSIQIRISRPLADEIQGTNSVCPNAQGISYRVQGAPASTYLWFVSGGTIASGGTDSLITVNWGNQGMGEVRVVEVTAIGCIGDTIRKAIIKDYTLFTAPMVGDTSLCEFTNGQVYFVPNTEGSNYDWTVVGGTLRSGQGTNSVIIDWDVAQTAFVTVTEYAFDDLNQRACVGRPVNKVVYVHPIPTTSPIAGPVEVCEEDSVQFSVTGFAGSRYIWRVNGQVLPDSTSAINYVFAIQSNQNDTFYFEVTEISKDTCQGPTQFKLVRMYRLPRTSEIAGPQVVCAPNLNGQPYSVIGLPTSTFEWTVLGGTIESGLGTDSILVNWVTPGTGVVQVQEINEFGCRGLIKTKDIDVDSLHVRMKLVTTALNDDKVIEVHWLPSNNQFHTDYWVIYRRAVGVDATFRPIDSVRFDQSMFTDTKVQTGKYSYEYYVTSRNQCQYNIASDTHQTILLVGRVERDSIIVLDWNAYKGWLEGVDRYHVYREVNKSGNYELMDLTKGLNTDLVSTLDAYQQCYRIGGFKAGPDSLQSLSNKACFEFDPLVWIPNAFTPFGEDLLNNKFRPILGYVKEYEMDIYNRWGQRIFSTTNPADGWDGTFNGARCPMDGYMYIINVRGAKDRIKHTGILHLTQ